MTEPQAIKRHEPLVRIVRRAEMPAGRVALLAGLSLVLGILVGALFILLLGPTVEDRFGSWNTLWAILVTAFVTGLVYFIFFPGSALLGASGIVFMMILMASFGGARNGVIPITTIFVAVFYLGGELWNAIFQQNNIAELAHIVGGLCGMLMGFALSGKRKR